MLAATNGSGFADGFRIHLQPIRLPEIYIQPLEQPLKDWKMMQVAEN